MSFELKYAAGQLVSSSLGLTFYGSQRVIGGPTRMQPISKCQFCLQRKHTTLGASYMMQTV
ncbi:hypothetical protein PISMIDRAFT_688449 [Pisolithus microcarpus 441]|uniref:Uncharacterized protein n=1 Tax=Pisolithus microcarpus 441 TaxID=765257 RepID=A0A0C9Y9Z7_9AGAM|nr:hypothetical protein PISMIDRAFT_688449 [Pisolithus microcarpus 441]